MNSFELAFKEMEREGRTPKDKNYGTIWVRRVYQINNYLTKMDAKKKSKK